MRTGRTRKLAFVALALVGAAIPNITVAGSVAGLGAAPNDAASPGCGGIGSADFGSAGDRVGLASATSPELSMFVAAVEAAGLSDMLDGDEPFTIFAPNDAAFEKIPANVLEAILADTELLTTILTYHVVPEARSSAALAEAGTAATLNGGELSFALDGDALTINGYQATVVCADLTVARSTVHVIDAFLLPTIDDLVEGAASSGPGSGPTTTSTTTTTLAPTTTSTSTTTSTTLAPTTTSTSTSTSTTLAPTTTSTSTTSTTLAPTTTTRPAGIAADVVIDTIARGQIQTGTGTGFQPGEVVHGVQHSIDLDLGSQTADANGNVTFRWTIRSTETLGAHTFEVTGPTSGTASAPFTVVAGTIPATGTNSASTVVIALMLTLAGATLLLVTLRRSHR